MAKKDIATDVSVYRDDLPDSSIQSDARKQAPFMVVLGGQYSYLAKLNGKLPGSIRFTGLGFTA
jgi:hypothetical protein